MADKYTDAMQKEDAKMLVAQALGLIDEGSVICEKDTTEYGSYKFSVDVELKDGTIRPVKIELTAPNIKPTIKQVEAKGGAFDAGRERELWLEEKAEKAKIKAEVERKKAEKIAKDKAKREKIALAKAEHEKALARAEG